MFFIKKYLNNDNLDQFTNPTYKLCNELDNDSCQV